MTSALQFFNVFFVGDALSVADVSLRE